MKNLIVDIGNTRVKYALMRGRELIASTGSADFDLQVAKELLAQSDEAVRWAVLCSTRSDGRCEVRELERLGLQPLLFDADCPVPLGNDYLSPRTLGRDRLAAAVGADLLYGDRPLLIVDFGTAITCDVVSEHTFRGGFISPGRRMRLRALHDYTARLPLVEPATELLPWGRTTEEALAQGVEQGILGEVEGHIARFREKFGDLLIIFAGGEAKHFAKQIKNAIFADCDLVLVGLNRILEYHIHAEK